MMVAPSRRVDPELLEAAYAAAAEGVASGSLPSAVLAVATARETLRLEAFGPVATDSIFLIASITKPIFATAMLRLVERGRILLNDPVASFIPEFAANGKSDVRLWHLLTHTSGLDELFFDPASRLSWAEAVERACAAPLLFRPGSRYAYANVSFGVMAELIERVTGQDHASYVRQAVLEPLGMLDTTYLPPDSPRVAPVLDPPWGSDPAGRAPWIHMQIPAAGLWSTAADLVCFGQMLLRGGELDGSRVLAPATVRAMTSLQTDGIPVVAAGGEFRSLYGLGFSKAGLHGERGPSAELRTPAGFGHGGATGGHLLVEPELDLVLVCLSNRWGVDEPHLRRAMNAAIAAASVYTSISR